MAAIARRHALDLVERALVALQDVGTHDRRKIASLRSSAIGGKLRVLARVQDAGRRRPRGGGLRGGAGLPAPRRRRGRRVGGGEERGREGGSGGGRSGAGRGRGVGRGRVTGAVRADSGPGLSASSRGVARAAPPAPTHARASSLVVQGGPAAYARGPRRRAAKTFRLSGWRGRRCCNAGCNTRRRGRCRFSRLHSLPARERRP